MHRMMLPVVALLAGCSIIATAVVAGTPPKKTTEGTAMPTDGTTRPGAADQATRPGPSAPSVWFGCVSEIEVTVVQQNEITPVIRRYQADLKRWSTDGAVKMKALMDQARTAEEPERQALMKQVRALRKSMPRYDRVKKEVTELLTPFQRARLEEVIRENRIASRQRLAPAATRERDDDQGASADDGDAQGGENPDRDADGESAIKKPTLWHFKNDLDPERHNPPKTASDPVENGRSGESTGREGSDS